MSANVPMTLEESIQFVVDNVSDGIECPCCTLFVKKYKRKLHSGMALRLISLYRISQTGWINVNDIYTYGLERGLTESVAPLDFPYLKFWELIETQKPDPVTGKKNSGLWKITQKGIDFVENKEIVPKHIFMMGGKALHFSSEFTTIDRCLKDQFNYRQLMST